MSNKKAAQQELRRLMSMQKLKKSAEAPKRIESPLASYSPGGALKCNVCRVAVVGGEASWPQHVASREHMGAVNARKGNKRRLETVAMLAPQAPPPPKKLKGILKNAATVVVDEPIVQQRGTLREAIPPPRAAQARADDNVRLASREGGTVPPTSAPPLPEGFFDDPEQDARARNMEYRDPAEEEWARFTREMKGETEASARIIADDQDAATAERQIDEIDEQMRNWGRVVQLEQRVEEARGRGRGEEDGSSSPDDLDFDEFPDWRRKKAYAH